MPQRRTLPALTALILALAPIAQAQAQTPTPAETAAYRARALTFLAPCGVAPDALTLGWEPEEGVFDITLTGDAYTDANLACIADAALKGHGAVTFQSAEVTRRFYRVFGERPWMQVLRVQARDQSRQRLQQSGVLARLPAPGTPLATLAPQVETACGLHPGDVLQVRDGSLVIAGAGDPSFEHFMCVMDSLAVLQIEPSAVLGGD